MSMSVKIWREKVTIPTYETGKRDKNPMFFEMRVYQGSSGRVYPLAMIDKISDVKTEKEYLIVFLENEYIQVQVMPELGGRIYRALDKTNNYDFVYYNRVIKPALVGLTGPWISGGIEFNWPQHHRPNTFGPVEYKIDDSRPDIKTVWLSETDRMYGTKVTTGIAVRSGVAAIEILGVLFNPTNEPQTFLWWANPAVAVHDETFSIFPPDVHAVMDHGKRDVSRFPIATGIYYKADYSAGVDISQYKNIPVPTSYMAYHSDYDFVGNYDRREQAGVLHIADHHISPGKKQWTWGNGEFGQAWDRNLTDEDGPYIELMAGVFTDNQPDFTWLAPYSGKNFTQYFIPYKAVGAVKCANSDIVAGLEASDGKAIIRLYASKALEDAKITLKKGDVEIYNMITRISPVDVFEAFVETTADEWELTLMVEATGAQTLTYMPKKTIPMPTPNPAKAIDMPDKLLNNEALLLAGLHLEQYRHATYRPEEYYKEGLKRYPGDIRINNAYGSLLLRRGQFEEAIKLFEASKQTATRHNPNPYDGEVFYNLGRAYDCLGKADAAYAAYYKAIWSDAWRSQGYYGLSTIAARQGRVEQALEFAKESIWANYKNFSARAAVAVFMRVLGKKDDAALLLKETTHFDPMDIVAARELEILRGIDCGLKELIGTKSHSAINLAVIYMSLGRHNEAVDILKGHLNSGGEDNAMVYYYIAHAQQLMNDPDAANAWILASKAKPDYCFPNTIDDYIVLRHAITYNSEDPKAYYYLGCFLYDKKRYDDAQVAWEKSAAIDESFPTVHRNLALYYANKRKDYTRAGQLLEKAFALNKDDARVFYELCELNKKIGLTFAKQRKIMEENISLVNRRDDLTALYAEALIGLDEFEDAINLLTSRKFHPWEGGEGKIPMLHIEARLGLARKLISTYNYSMAIVNLEKALIYYTNFGEGKLSGARENNIYYKMGLAFKQLDAKKAAECFEKAADGMAEPANALYYNDQPPHIIYYQGVALAELGRKDEARSRFNKLIAYGEKHLFEKQTMDYFAVSLPDFLVFETDLDEKNKTHCYYMMGLGYMGLGEIAKAREAFETALAITPCHLGVLSHLAQL